MFEIQRLSLTVHLKSYNLIKNDRSTVDMKVACSVSLTREVRVVFNSTGTCGVQRDRASICATGTSQL